MSVGPIGAGPLGLPLSEWAIHSKTMPHFPQPRIWGAYRGRPFGGLSPTSLVD